MAISVKNIKPAKRYAKALIELRNENLSVDKISEDMNFIINEIDNNEELKAFLNSPIISKADKKDVLDKIFSNRIDNYILNFLFLLNENSRLNVLEDIFSSFMSYSDDEKGILNVFITSAIELSSEQKNALVLKLQNKTKKNINPEFIIDNGILGGLIMKINDTVIDLSLKKRIENLKRK